MAAVVILLGGIGAVAWGYAADRRAQRNARAKMTLPAGCLVVAALLLAPAFGFLPPGNLQFLAIAAGGFMMTAATGAIPSVAIDVIHPGLRASAAAMVAVVQNLFGLAAGPFLAGVLSDAVGLATALALMSLFCLASAAVLVAGARAYPAELAQAEALAARVAAA